MAQRGHCVVRASESTLTPTQTVRPAAAPSRTGWPAAPRPRACTARDCTDRREIKSSSRNEAIERLGERAVYAAAGVRQDSSAARFLQVERVYSKTTAKSTARQVPKPVTQASIIKHDGPYVTARAVCVHHWQSSGCLPRHRHGHVSNASHYDVTAATTSLGDRDFPAPL